MNIKQTFFLVMFTAILLGFSSCGGGGADVVESGTYQGTISEVNAEEQEIYVKTSDDKTLELYFTDSTELTQNGENVNFSVLEKDQPVEVTVEKMGKKLNPLEVKIK
ncbi:MAG TPA: hypothetical protein VJ876_04325 [Bacteroidales bacterium]|nr:hypothetical protein [Bacteroidales bacterium]